MEQVSNKKINQPNLSIILVGLFVLELIWKFIDGVCLLSNSNSLFNVNLR